MSRPRLVLVHGRAQGGKNSGLLKQEWLTALRHGLGSAREDILDDIQIEVPFYSDMLDQFVRQMGDAIPEDIRVRGPSPDMNTDVDNAFLAFEADMVKEIIDAQGAAGKASVLTELDAVATRGPLNWEWVQALLRSADRIPGLSAGTIEAFTRDVYVYLSRSLVRKKINATVSAAIGDGPAVVVGHSLGSVVAYDVLKPASFMAEVPALITIGSPLATGPIRRTLQPLVFPSKVHRWFNAYDNRDFISLHALDKITFPVQPGIQNYAGVVNNTPNAHGISGYLSDPVVATAIFEGLSGITPAIPS